MTAANGSGRRLNRLGFALAMMVGRTSPSFHAVRKLERNSSNVGEVGFAVSPRAGLSAMPAIVKNDPWWLDPKDLHRPAYVHQGLFGPTVPTRQSRRPAGR